MHSSTVRRYFSRSVFSRSFNFSLPFLSTVPSTSFHHSTHKSNHSIHLFSHSFRNFSSDSSSPSSDSSSSSPVVLCRLSPMDLEILTSLYHAGQYVRQIFVECKDSAPILQSGLTEALDQLDYAIEVLRQLFSDVDLRDLTPDDIEPAVLSFTASANSLKLILSSSNFTGLDEVEKKLEVAYENLKSMSLGSELDGQEEAEQGSEDDLDKELSQVLQAEEELEKKIYDSMDLSVIFPPMAENKVELYKKLYGPRPGDDYQIQQEILITDDLSPDRSSADDEESMYEIQDSNGGGIKNAFAMGARKMSKAFVRIKPGTGDIWINKKRHSIYFDRWVWTHAVIRPLEVTGTLGKYDVFAVTSGGGKSGQAGAVRLAIARIIKKLEPDLAPALKGERLLTRDRRVPERKKFGQKGARARFTFLRR
jgi:small subunit ribosomal protein S9